MEKPRTLEKLSYLENLTKTTHGWNTHKERLFLYSTAKSLTGRGVIVEIGSWKGKSTIWLAHGSKAGKGVKVYAIDPFTGSSEHQRPGEKVRTFEEFKINIAKVGVNDIVSPLVAFSEIAALIWNKPIEFLFIDGAHEFEAVEKDFLLWSPFLIEGGIIAFHDTAPDLMAVLNGIPLHGLFGPRKVVTKYILKSKDYCQAGLVSSIVYATKCTNNHSFFAWFNRQLCRLKIMISYLVYSPYLILKSLPQPVRVFLKKLIVR